MKILNIILLVIVTVMCSGCMATLYTYRF